MRTITILILSASALLAQTPSSVSPAPNAQLTPQVRELDVTRAQMEFTLAERKLVELRKQYTDSHPNVIAAKAQLERLRSASVALSSEYQRTAALAKELTIDEQHVPGLEKKLAKISDMPDSVLEAAALKKQLEQLRTRIQELRSDTSVRAAAATLAEKAATAEQLEAIKAREAEIEARLSQLRKDHPDIAPLTQQLQGLRARERSLTSPARAINLTPEDIARLPVLTLSPDPPLGVGSPSFTPPNTLDRWWRNSSTAQSLGLSSDQQKRMDKVLQQFRLKLVDVNGALQKEEIALEPLVGADKLDEAKIGAQIDRVAQARAELEKVNGRMLLGIRKQLTPEQWRKLNQMSPSARP
ncbi:MAG: periplasmic heavy metal sensor [Acidobacteriota bacterium]